MIKIKIEDYYGNDVCSFLVNPFDEENTINAFGKFDGCDIADIDKEEDGTEVVRVQLWSVSR